MKTIATTRQPRGVTKEKVWLNVKKYYMLYLFLLPAIVYLVLFKYIPLYGVQIAFRNFNAVDGISGSPWAGLEHFIYFFESPRFWTLLGNTLTLSLYSLIASFPIPIALALLINYCPGSKLRKFTQTITYAPYFISTVVMASMVCMFLSPSSGLINSFLGLLGINPIHFMAEASWFKHVFVWSGVWQGAGWSSIIYVAALAGVDPQQHEAAIMDGANKFSRIWHIDLPAIMPTAIILLVLNMGQLLNVGFEKVLLLQNDVILNVSEIISTYVYKVGLINFEFSYSTAIGLFNNVINFAFLIAANRFAKKVSGSSLW